MNEEKNLEDFIRNQRDAFNDVTPPTDLWDSIEDQLEEEDEEEQDPVGEFIGKHRGAFDTETPPPRLEEAVFAQLDELGTPSPLLPRAPARKKTSIRSLIRVLAIAASVALVISVAYGVGSRAGYATGQEDAIAAEMQRINPDVLETEAYYRREIATQFRTVSTLNDDPQLRKDLAEIDRATEEIRESLLDVPPSQRPELVAQLIQNYQLKLDILLRIQEQIPASRLPQPEEALQPTTNHENI